MVEPKAIYCPNCGCKCGTYDGRSTIDKIMKCQSCGKGVIYRTSTGNAENIAIPKRSCSSGMVFI